MLGSATLIPMTASGTAYADDETVFLNLMKFMFGVSNTMSPWVEQH